MTAPSGARARTNSVELRRLLPLVGLVGLALLGACGSFRAETKNRADARRFDKIDQGLARAEAMLNRVADGKPCAETAPCSDSGADA